MSWPSSPRILSEQLRTPAEPLALLLQAPVEAPPAAVCARAARTLLDLPAVPSLAPPAWLAPHQVPAWERLGGIVTGYSGGLLADAVGLGKSFVALAVAHTLEQPFALVVPAVLVGQWRDLLRRLGMTAPIVTHEFLSARSVRQSDYPTIRLVIVDEAHRFRNPETRRYRALARFVVGARVLLVTATPVVNRLSDLLHLFRLFLRDHALAGLGLPSLRRAARGDVDRATLDAVTARLVVSRSRERVGSYAIGPVPLAFPTRRPARTLRLPVVSGATLDELMAGVARLGAGHPAGALLRLMLLRRLASSAAAFRTSLERYAGYIDLAQRAAADGRALTTRAFQRLFPDSETPELQLALFPLLLDAGVTPIAAAERSAVAELRRMLGEPGDPKADALETLLGDGLKTIVFTDARPTVRWLVRRLGRRFRVAGVVGESGLFGAERVTRDEVIRAFSPEAQGAPPPASALQTDVLIATDLLSEGLNLQDAGRVVHYDLPWSPARLAQRVGRVDRIGAAHACIETATFLPPAALAGAITQEQRLLTKARLQTAAGAAQIETANGPDRRPGPLDWCDRLQALAAEDTAPPGVAAAVAGSANAAVLVVRIGDVAEAVVVDGGIARSDPTAATGLLQQAAAAPARPLDRPALAQAIASAAPLVRARLSACANARWRAGDRDALSRRLIPWVLAEARRAARRRDARLLNALDNLVTRLSLGMTAGEELLLDDLLAGRRPLAVRGLLTWHARLPPLLEPTGAPETALVAAVQVRG